MLTSLRYLLPVLLLGFLSGCSIFGIATNGDLEKQNELMAQEMATMQQSVGDQMARVSGQLGAMEEEMYVAMADLERLNKDNTVELIQIRTRFETIQGRLQVALIDLENVATSASRAEAGSRQAVQLHQDAQLAERERLQNRLRELDVQISNWYRTESPAEELRPELQPESPVQDVTAQRSNNTAPLPRAGLRIPPSDRQNNNR